MGVWQAVKSRLRGWAGGRSQAPTQQFSTSGPIDALITGLFSTWINGGPISRDDAMSVAAVQRGRDEIAAIATLPLQSYRGADVVPNAFLEQVDPDVPQVVMLAQTVEDLICDGYSCWLKTGLDARGFPTSARRVINVSLTPPSDQDLAPLPSGIDPRGSSVWVDGQETPAFLVIRFDSPGRPLMTTGARTIRRALLLDALAQMYADNPRPLEAFTDTDNQTVQPYTDPQVEAFLATWKRRRKAGGAAYIPAALKREDITTPSPSELQLVELQREVSLELAVMMGLDAEDVGVNTTSRTYFNSVDRKTDKINRTLGPMMKAITDRLSMGDITPRGQVVRFDLTDYLRPDPTTLAAYWQALLTMGAVDVQWIAEQANIPGDVIRRVLAAPAPPAPALPPAVDPGQQHRPPALTLPAQLGPALTAQRQLARVGFSLGGQPAEFRFAVADFATATPPPKVDSEKRTITGLAVPYGAVARKYGVGFRFAPGSLEYDAGNLNRLRAKYDHADYIGVTNAVNETADGPVVTLKVLDGPDGSPAKMQRDQVLMDAAGGLADGLSVGVDFDLASDDVRWSEAEQVFDVVRATWNETSVTPDPAFTGARVTSVAASRGGTMPCTHCGRLHPGGMACVVAAQLYPPPAQQPANPGAQVYNAAGLPALQQQYAAAGFQQQPAQPVQPYAMAPVQQPVQQPAAPVQGHYAAQVLPPPGGPVTAEQLTAALTAAVDGMVASGQVAQQFAQPVNPGAMPLPGGQPTAGGPANYQMTRVAEPDPYALTFDNKGFGIIRRGTHDLSDDYIRYFRDGDLAAHDRALSFIQRKMAALFNVATTDVDETNPTKQRPDLYVDQRQYQYPIWSAINKGSLTDIAPFTFPQFSSASGLVAAHTQGTEPTTGTFVTTGQTVTPTAYSGKARINREVWDQGGNPQISTLIWNQIVRGVNEALEAAAVTLLNAGSFTALNTFTAGAVDRAAAGKTLGSELEHGIALLQFARGGYAFTDAFGQADLYITLTDAADTAGAKLYPQLGPTNRNGQADSKFSSINVGGQQFMPAWALAAAGQTAATKSYLLDRTAVNGWASAPQRLTMDNVAVAYIDLGVWGYQATAVSDTNGVRTISWDPVA